MRRSKWLPPLLLSAAAAAAAGRAPPDASGASWLRVQLRAGACSTAYERAWRCAPAVSLDAFFGTSRFAYSIDGHAFWFAYDLQPDVLAHAHDASALRHAIGVTLCRDADYGAVAVSPDLAAALRALDRHGLEARVRASALQLDARCAARVARAPALTRSLADRAAALALARLGASG